jgi:hypothetical protein
MEGGIAIFLILLILVGGAVAFIVFGGGGGLLASRKRQDVAEGTRQGRAAAHTHEHLDDTTQRRAESRGTQADRPAR